MNINKSLLISLPLAIAALVSTATHAQTEQEKGFEIAARSDRTDLGFGDSKVEAKMVLRNAAGQETTRELRFNTLEKENEDVGDKSLVFFQTPRDVEGTALLSHAKILEPDDQWLYLPALKRVKRISSRNKSGPFVGSEFAFEDFTTTELNKFTYKYLREEPCGEFTCDVVEREPRYENSGYTKQISYIDQQDYQPRKLEFYDRRGDLLKVLSFSNYKKYDNGVWRAHTLNMENVQTNKKTDLIYEEYTFKTGLGNNDFVKGKLSRLR
ncbi:outer membrane lipoprotein-sorting protein [Sessilibacter corallicola]|uniref:Outer membrane lipoprotein-sorting protein n=1 Tax=Sessilibacter corallicola TaxID=2904075 RepID=A0ABQ0ACA9_9GAMM